MYMHAHIYKYVAFLFSFVIFEHVDFDNSLSIMEKLFYTIECLFFIKYDLYFTNVLFIFKFVWYFIIIISYFWLWQYSEKIKRYY